VQVLLGILIACSGQALHLALLHFMA
jgi:hypothetical protein